jgi:hypothetical protein
MTETLKFDETPGKLTIRILPAMKPIVKAGLVLQGVIMAGAAVFLLALVAIMVKDMLFSGIVFGVVSVVYFFAGRKYLDKVFGSEDVEVTSLALVITERYMMHSVKQAYLIQDIKDIVFAGQQQFTPHEFDNPSTDFTGLAATEKEIQYLIEDGTLELITKTGIRRFGKNIPSWDAEEIITRISAFTGLKLNRQHGEATVEEE